MKNYLVFTSLKEFNAQSNAPVPMPINSSYVFLTEEPKKALTYIREIQAKPTQTTMVYILELEPERECSLDGFSKKEEDSENIVYMTWQSSVHKGDWTERFSKNAFLELVSE